ncbi:MAG: SMC-Scp complex subunit ScpB [Candidatus Omnitrophota bacterium]
MQKIKRIVEALLVISEAGLTKQQLYGAIEEFPPKDIDEALKSLREEYDRPERSFTIAEIAGRYRMVSKPEYLPWINNLYRKDVDRLTGPSLETLAIIAYKQPATRAEVEFVRGVNVGGVIKTLIEKDLIVIKGRKDVPGRPLMYSTTQKFLEVFGLNSLEDLPLLRDFTEEDLEYDKRRLVTENTGFSENTGPDSGNGILETTGGESDGNEEDKRS